MNRNKEISLCIIKGKRDEMEFFSEVCKLATKYAKKRGMDSFSRNTNEGYYELYMTEKEGTE